MKYIATTIETDTQLTPVHRYGVKMDTVETKPCNSEAEAQALFLRAEKRLLDINGWNQLAGAKDKQYALTDSAGNFKTGLAEEGDYICFDLPAPGSGIGEGQDWVQIKKMVKRQEPYLQYTAFMVRTAPNPQVNDKAVAHFYKKETTNTFVIERRGHDVTAAVYGRNEIPNVSDTNGLYNKLRNAMIGIGSWLGISKAQWKILAKRLVEKM